MKNLIQSNFLAASLIFAICLLGFIVEAFLLNAIVTHPASSQSNSDGNVLFKFLTIAALPYLFFVAPSILKNNIDKQNRKLFSACYLTILGVVFGLLALRQYGHATPGFLFFGYVWQWLIIVWYLYKRYINNHS
jgi:O-antigen/teichoic acid export membrane protein